tara:strand:- start:190 stop:339 length:150 start_codon:yes stop_codon:yes gene_type:complete
MGFGQAVDLYRNKLTSHPRFDEAVEFMNKPLFQELKAKIDAGHAAGASA